MAYFMAYFNDHPSFLKYRRSIHGSFAGAARIGVRSGALP